jgi:hypothetical protein
MLLPMFLGNSEAVHSIQKKKMTLFVLFNNKWCCYKAANTMGIRFELFAEFVKTWEGALFNYFRRI